LSGSTTTGARLCPSGPWRAGVLLRLRLLLVRSLGAGGRPSLSALSNALRLFFAEKQNLILNNYLINLNN